MIKCFLLASGLLFCTESNIDIKCFEDQLNANLARPMKFNQAINQAAEECKMNTQGCCSFHGGLDYYAEDLGVWICRDNTESPTCRRK